MYDMTGSIVTYNTEREDLKKVIGSFLNTDLNIKLWISDNSPSEKIKNEIKELIQEIEEEYNIKNINDKIEYIFNNSNRGYGAGHNSVIEKFGNEMSKYHLILNPDIYFEIGTLEKLFKYMEEHPKIGQIMPKVKYPNGEIQYLCKLIPTPLNLIFRRFFPLKKIKEKMDYDYEMKWSGYDKIMEVPILSGCFMFFRTEKLVSLKGFDERFFMYLEDYDLSRRMNEISETVYYPYAEIVHNHAKESYKSPKMTKIHIKSAIKYFNKWGWVFDKKRRETNKKIKENFIKSEKTR
ncbi:glycosyltransferase family 2 protein [Leptotrichia sp. OH3620_COT-345]|uniref:glycosyltransferase family 2 protein n=1 Tax=Leptotrichia sp. OH3620_COT-345 TaxID=2491048 RepID=UPI000F6502BE|nr:glycosyltransferase family 2 protein [Leptotrichia sp. OH3620_COT-345]RRD40768.1 glycosyltransferase family 2 protein [Leptotrichia sp. OH3620_COT-345]